MITGGIARRLFVPFFVLLGAGAVQVGCATGSTVKHLPPVRTESFAAIDVVDADPSGGASPDVKRKFESLLADVLFNKTTFAPGEGGLTIRYRVMRYDPGSQLTQEARHGKLTVDADYLDKSLQQLARITVESEIAGGVTDGVADEALGEAADEIGGYTKKYFR